MTNSATPNLLSLIRKIREERRSGDLMRLTDAELVAKLARGLSSNTGDERLIACALSVSRRAPHARPDQRDGDLGRALALLQEAGYSGFSLAQLAAVRQSAAFRKLRDLRAPFVVWGKQLTDLGRRSVPNFSSASATYQSRLERPRAAKADGCRDTH
jgi:hypothetical protein